jgi:hypothetical protein
MQSSIFMKRMSDVGIFLKKNNEKRQRLMRACNMKDEGDSYDTCANILM